MPSISKIGEPNEVLTPFLRLFPSVNLFQPDAVGRYKQEKACGDGSYDMGSQNQNVVAKREHFSFNFYLLLVMFSVIALKIFTE